MARAMSSVEQTQVVVKEAVSSFWERLNAKFDKVNKKYVKAKKFLEDQLMYGIKNPATSVSSTVRSLAATLRTRNEAMWSLALDTAKSETLNNDMFRFQSCF